MDYYKKRMYATAKIRKLVNKDVPVSRIVLVILEEFGLSKKFVEETYDLITKELIGGFDE